MKLSALFANAWRRQWRWLALGVALMLLSAVASLALLGLSGWLITASGLAGLGLLATIDIFTPGGGIRLATLTRTLARYGERLATHRATLGLLAAVRVNLMRRILRLDERQLRRLRRGDTLNRLTRDVESLDHVFSGIAGPLVTAALTTVGVAALLYLLVSVQAALVPLALGIAGALVTASLARAGNATSRALALAEPELSRQCTDSLEGLKSLIAENQIERHRQTLEVLSNTRVARQRKLDRLDATGRGLIHAAGFSAVWGLLVIALQASWLGAVSAPLAVMSVVVVMGMNEVWQVLPAAWRQLTHSRLAAHRIAELAGREPLLDRSGDAMPPRDGAIRLEGLRFAWPRQPRALIDDIDLRIEAGERLLVGGPSGCGKTTLALLLMRQIDPDEGTVRLGGLDLRDIDADALRRHIGYLPQHPTLFADTLAANLRIAAPTANDESIEQALHRAGLGRWLASLESGLDTWLDETGASLSGGEMRRLGLARLMLIDPPVVVLDEPTTGLDPQTASELASNLDEWLRDRTVVMISHEPRHLPRHDHVLRLSDQ